MENKANDIVRTMNEKLGLWMEEVLIYFSNEEMQEKIYDMPKLLEGIGLTEGEMERIKYLSDKFLKLSFIIKNHEKEIEKLIEYWKK